MLLLQCGGRVAAEGLGEVAPGRLVRGQRLGRAARPRPARASAGRRGPRAAGARRPAGRARRPGRQPPGRPRRAGCAAVGLDPVGVAPAGAPRRAGRVPASASRLSSSGSGSPRQRASASVSVVCRQRGCAGRELRMALRGERGEPDGVDVVGLDVQPVAAGELLDQRPGRRACGAGGRPATAARWPGRPGPRRARAPRSARGAAPAGRRRRRAGRAGCAAACPARRRPRGRRAPRAGRGSRSARGRVCQPYGCERQSVGVRRSSPWRRSCSAGARGRRRSPPRPPPCPVQAAPSTDLPGSRSL